MKKIKWIIVLCLLLVVCIWGMTATASEETEQKESDSIVGFMIQKIANGEVETGDEDSIRETIKAGEEELSITLTEKEEDRIVDFVKSLDTIEVGAEDFIDQAGALYNKYSSEVVEQANDAINEAVESAAKGAVDSFFRSLKQAVSDFFTNLFSE